MPSRTITRQDQVHYVVYKHLTLEGFSHDLAYATATAVVADLKAAGLTVTKRSVRREA